LRGKLKTMKRSTHILSGFAVSFALSRAILGLNAFSVATGFFGALLNDFIDRFGHRGPTRSALTHSAITSSIIGLLFALAEVSALQLLSFKKITALAIITAVLSLLSASLLHIVLDSVTVEGVPALWPLKKNYVGLRLIRYNNALANILVQALSAILIAVSVLC